MMKNIPNYIGTFSKDTLPSQITKSASAVINLDDIGNPGTHWVAVYNDADSMYVEYFDSFGMTPPMEIESYLRTSNKPILFSTGQVQAPATNICGKLCTDYIRFRSKGITPYKIIHNKFNIFVENI
jgi:hypothetical protein